MTAVYPGSFDPTTYGHLDIITRASKLVDHLYVAVLANPVKDSLFTVEERKKQLQMITASMENVEIAVFSGLLVDFAKMQNAKLVIRGLRALTDFEYEFQMALTNRELAGEIETLFIPTSKEFLYLSSSVVKEIAQFGGDYFHMVPTVIRTALELKYSLDK